MSMRRGSPTASSPRHIRFCELRVPPLTLARRLAARSWQPRSSHDTVLHQRSGVTIAWISLRKGRYDGEIRLPVDAREHARARAAGQERSAWYGPGTRSRTPSLRQGHPASCASAGEEEFPDLLQGVAGVGPLQGTSHPYRSVLLALLGQGSSQFTISRRS